MSYLRQLHTILSIAPCSQAAVDRAFAADCPDFEDALQVFSAMEAGAEIIITRDPRHFAFAPIPVMSAQEFVDAYFE